MYCPFCPGTESRVVDSRLVADGKATRRRRECESCRRRFTTYERVEYNLPTVVKKNGTREPFSRDKLVRSLRVACDKRSVSLERLDGVAASVEAALAETNEREVTSQAIGLAALAALKDLDAVAYVRFASVYRSFKDVEDFLAEMSRLVRDSTPS
jgi:transcriptional repressor NrdR